MSRTCVCALTTVFCSRLPQVLLDGNLWTCDACHVTPLLSRVVRSAPTSPLRRLRCRAPWSLAGEPLESLELGTLSWCSPGPGVAPDSPRSLLSADSQLGVIAAAAAVALLIMAGAALLAIVAYSKHHADYYYTHVSMIWMRFPVLDQYGV